MASNAQLRPARGSTDKWFGMARIGANAMLRLAFSVLIAPFGEGVFAVFVGLSTIEIVATTVQSSQWLTPLGSIAPRLGDDVRDAFVHAALARTLRATALLALLLAAGVVVATPIADVPWATWLAFCASTGAWLASSATAAALATRFRSRVALRGQCGAALGPALGLWLAQAHGADPLVAYFLGNALGHGLAVWPMWRALPGSGGAVAAEVMREFEVHGRVSLSGSIANSICTRVQPFVLAAVGGAPAIALFGAANTLVGPARVFSGALGDVLRPRLALHRGGDPARARRAIGTALLGLGAVGIAMLVLFIAAGEAIGLRVFGPDFDGLGAVLPWAAAFVLAASVVNVLVVAMQIVSIRGAAIATRTRIVAAVLSLAAVWPACAWDGARGAFIAMAVFEVVFLVVAVRFLAGQLRPAGVAGVVEGAS